MLQNRNYEPVATSEDTPPSQQVVLNLEQSERLPDPSTTPPHQVVLNLEQSERAPDPSTPPPPYSATYVVLPPGDANEPPELPPAYNIADLKLPSYEEAEERKNSIANVRLTLDGGGEVELGSDWTFVSCFLVSFIFNWIGFLAGYCMTKSVAGRYGSIGGFGLSLVKWSLIIKNSSHNNDQFGAPWMWWVFVAAGWLIFIRGILVYVHIKILVKKGRGLMPRYWGMPLGNNEPGPDQ